MKTDFINPREEKGSRDKNPFEDPKQGKYYRCEHCGRHPQDAQCNNIAHYRLLYKDQQYVYLCRAHVGYHDHECPNPNKVEI